MHKEMDLVSSCKVKLASFRIKELKDVLTQLGLAKQGRKQDLMDRILALLSNEEISEMHGSARKHFIGKEGVAKIIDDAYRKMKVSGAIDLATKGQSGSDISCVKPEEVEDLFHLDSKICCPCGSSLPTEFMIQCADPRCRVQQHICCVIIPEKTLEGVPPVPPQFYCEICRINRADPFLMNMAHPLSPVKLIASNMPADGTNAPHSVEKTFQLSRADRDLLRNTEYDVQAWCILLNDGVPFRMQWPLYADLQINGLPVRTFNRPGSQLLGANGRDDGPMIGLYIREGINKISLSGGDARVFCFGVRLVKRHTVQEVLSLIPKESDGELFEDALARVCRCIRGGIAPANEDSDSDLEVIADSMTVNLRCPVSGSRMKIAGRFKPCAHKGCFDLETFVELNQRSRKWQCPFCLKNYSLEDIIIDPYFNRITTMMRHCGEDITEIDVKSDGSWCEKNECEFKDLGQWHLPDGSLRVATVDIISNLETSKQIKQEDILGHSNLKLGIKKNHSGAREVSRTQDIHTLSSGNQLEAKFENYSQKVITMSSSATGSRRDDEDPSINQDGTGDISTNNGNEINSIHHNFDPTYGIVDGSSFAPLGDTDIIILSDSEEDDVNLISPETLSITCPVNYSGSFSAAPENPDSYPEGPALDAGVSSHLGLFDDNGNDIGMPQWPFPSSTRAGPGFELFGTDTDVSDVFIDLEHTSVTCSAPLNGYSLASKSIINSGRQVLDSSVCPPNTDMNDGIVDNPLAFVGEDPSLQNFLPSQPAGMSAQSELGDQPPISTGVHAKDWISLRLGDSGGGAGAHAEFAASDGLDLKKRFESNEASLLLGMNDEASSNRTTNKKRSDGPFSFPRQPRSARRLYLSIDSD